MSVTASAVEVNVRRSGSATVSGTLVAIDDSTIEVTTSEQSQQLPLASVLSVTRLDDVAVPPPSMGRIMVDFVDRSRLAVRSFRLGDGQVVGETSDGSPFSLPDDTVSAVLFLPLSPSQQGRWRELCDAPGDGDMVVVRRNGQLDFIQLAVDDVADQSLNCTLDGQSLEVKRTKVVGIV
ncbi:MAG: hypothetical protein KDA63_07765, partial [Planctomycetales bacterium]|nr:hypothetical protein [Planctomycetales bacterium]